MALTGVKDIDNEILDMITDEEVLRLSEVSSKLNRFINDVTFWKNRCLKRKEEKVRFVPGKDGSFSFYREYPYFYLEASLVSDKYFEEEFGPLNIEDFKKYQRTLKKFIEDVEESRHNNGEELFFVAFTLASEDGEVIITVKHFEQHTVTEPPDVTIQISIKNKLIIDALKDFYQYYVSTTSH